MDKDKEHSHIYFMKGGICMTIFCVYKKKMLLLSFCAVIVSGIWCLRAEISQRELVFAEEYLDMYSGSYALMDGDTGRVLTGKEESSPMANASTTKILTCIVTLENCALEEEVTISSNAAGQPKVRYGVKEGEKYQLKELLYGLMLESYNDCAVAIAEHVAGSEEEFAKLLNAKAKEIGCKDTYFITPNGLDAENEGGFHHTTAEDLCKMMAYCVWESPKKESFLEITQTKSYGEFVNRNTFLEQMEGVLSGKTGFTSKAGYCYVAALEENGERYTIALLACGWPNNKDYKWHDAKKLFSYGLENYDVKTVEVEAIEEPVEIDGYRNHPSFLNLNQSSLLKVKAEKQSYEILMSAKERLRIETIWYDTQQLPIEKGTVLGERQLYLDDIKFAKIPLITTDSGYVWELKDVLTVIFFEFLSITSQ